MFLDQPKLQKLCHCLMKLIQNAYYQTLDFDSVYFISKDFG